MAYLRKALIPCSYFEAEKYLQLSHIVHQRFVAGDDGLSAEHFALACAIGQLVKEGKDSYRDDQWEHHDIEHLFNEDGSEKSSVVLEEPPASPPDAAKSADRAAGTGKSANKTKKVSVPVVPRAEASPSGSERNEGVTPSKERDKQGFDTAAYLEQPAAEMRDLASRATANAADKDRTSYTSNLALDKVIDNLRSSLPAPLAEAAIEGLLVANDQLREAPWVNVPGVAQSSPAELGRNYRLGALSAKDRHLANHMNRVGARVESSDADESHLLQADREARLNSADREVLYTLRKVLRGGGEFSHLDSKQKMKAMARLVRRQIHEADLDRQSKAAKASAAAETAAAAANSSNDKPPGDGDDDGSISSGDTVSSSEDSRASRDTYQEDGFCVRDGGSGDSSGGSDSGSGSDTDSMDECDKKRAKQRAESANSLGTPKKSRGKPALAAPAPFPPIAGDRPPSLVLLGDEDLAMWKSGMAKYKMGFHWESYLYHKQQFDNYKAHRGRYYERTFKSVIDAKLVPTVCSSCGFQRSKWASVSDARLILRIERVLRPSKSTDFAMELKEIRLEHFGNEPLQASYITFAEKFLSKVAEAADAGRPVKPVVVKAAYKAAIDREVPLKTWLEGDKWRGVDHAHKRLLRKLREARSWEAMSMSVKKKAQRTTHDDRDEDDADGRRGIFRPANKRRSNSTGKRMRKIRSNSSRVKRSNSTGFSGGRRDTSVGKREQTRSYGPREKLRTWKGCDSRGDCWHTDKELFDCFKKPCNADFCQRCARHGHTADYCKVPEGTEGLNTSGYFQEQRPSKSGPKRPPASRMNSSSGKRDLSRQSEGSCSEDDDSQASGGGRAKSNTSRRSNSSRGQSGRGRL